MVQVKVQAKNVNLKKNCNSSFTAYNHTFSPVSRKIYQPFMYIKNTLFESSLKLAVCSFCIAALCSESTDEKSLKFRETRNSCQMSREDNKTMCSVFRSSFLISFVTGCKANFRLLNYHHIKHFRVKCSCNEIKIYLTFKNFTISRSYLIYIFILKGLLRNFT